MKKIFLILLFTSINLISNTQASSDSKSTQKQEKSESEAKLLKEELNKYLPQELSHITTKYLIPNLILFSNKNFREKEKAELIKYLDNGQIDFSFGNNGIVKTDLDQIISIAQHGEKLIVLGSNVIEGEKNSEFPFNGYFYKYLINNGSLDKSFGKNGSVALNKDIDFGANSNIVIDRSGNITMFNGMHDIVRYNFNGDYVAKFQSIGSNFAIQPDGKVITLSDKDQTYNDQIIQKIEYLKDWVSDKTFGKDGKIEIQIPKSFIGSQDLGRNYYFDSIFIQKDGKIFLAGKLASSNKPLLLRLLSNGNIDYSFGNQKVKNGIYLLTDMINIEVKKIITQDDGKIIISGIDQYFSKDNNLLSKIALIRLTSDGLIDKSFNAQTDLERIFNENSATLGFNEITNANIQILESIGNKIIVGGMWNNGPAFLLGFNNDGSLDTTFQVHGIKI